MGLLENSTFHAGKINLSHKDYHNQGIELNLQPTTVKNRRNYLKRLIRFLKCKPFNLETAKAYIRHLKALGWKPASVNAEVKQLRAFVNFLFRKKYISTNFSRELVLFKLHRKQLNLIEPELVEKVIVAGCQPGPGDNSRNKKIKKDMRAALRFMLRTGLRVSELCSLKGSDFRLEDDPPNFTVTSKGGNQDVLPIPRDMIKNLLPKVKKKRVFEVRPESLNRALKRGARKLKVKTKIHCHLLRHIYATALLRSGVPPQIVQRLMRHRSFKTTNETYSHYLLEDLATATNIQSVVRTGLLPSEVFDEIEKAVRKTGIARDKRFKFVVNRSEKKLMVKVTRR